MKHMRQLKNSKYSMCVKTEKKQLEKPDILTFALCTLVQLVYISVIIRYLGLPLCLKYIDFLGHLYIVPFL